MRAIALALLLAACSDAPDGPVLGPAREPMHFDVEVRPDGVAVYSRPADAPDPCPNGFLGPGDCDYETDVSSCQPDVWISSMRLERGGVALGEQAPDEEFRAYFPVSDARGVELVLDDADEEVRVAVPEADAPAPTIDEIVDDGTTVATTWHADPRAASGIALLGGGFAGPRCHVRGETAVVLPSIATDSVVRSLYVFAYAEPFIRPTEFGNVTFWFTRVTGVDDVHPTP